MTRYVCIVFMILLPGFGFCQDGDLKIGQRYEPVYSQYWINGLAINPAYAGSRECFSNILLYRNQWMGFKGAPVTQTFSSHAAFKDEKNAAGFFLFHEEIGVSNYYDLYGNYAFRFQVWNGRLSLGLKAGATIFQGNYSEISASPEESNNDLLLEDEAGVFPNFGVGAYYYSEKFYVGLSIPQFISHELVSSQKKMSVIPANYDFLVTGGYLIGINKILKFKPSFLLRYRFDNTFQLDGGTNAILYDAIWLGVFFRYKNELAWVVEYQVTDQIKAGVAYDSAIGDLAGQQKGSLEIILRYDFKYKIKAEDPKYF